MLLLCESGGNVIIAQIHRRLFPMLSANVDDALPQSLLRALSASPLMDSKQLVSARLTLSYHNLIILMILLLNLRRCTCIHPAGSHGWTHCMNLTWGSGDVQGWQYTVVCLSMCVRACVCVGINMCMQMCLCASHFVQTNTAQQHRPQPRRLTQTTRRLWKTLHIQQPSALSVKHQSRRGLDCGVSSSPIELSGLI